jgi:hypothetical protein
VRYYFVVFVAKKAEDNVTANCFVACEGPFLVRNFRSFYIEDEEEFSNVCVTLFCEIDEESYLANTSVEEPK